MTSRDPIPTGLSSDPVNISPKEYMTSITDYDTFFSDILTGNTAWDGTNTDNCTITYGGDTFPTDGALAADTAAFLPFRWGNRTESRTHLNYTPESLSVNGTRDTFKRSLVELSEAVVEATGAVRQLVVYVADNSDAASSSNDSRGVSWELLIAFAATETYDLTAGTNRADLEAAVDADTWPTLKLSASLLA